MRSNFLIYGANGYTGELITRYAVERGLKPIIAGRNEAAIKALSEKHGLENRVFPLDDADKLDEALNEVVTVIHCAGPFSLTSRQMGEACLRTKTHYTDITGEIAVFEACAAADRKAKDAGIMVMPGVGFDVVPSDCLAMHLKDRLPTATHLTLAFYGMGRISHGTQATMTMNVGKGGAVRREGKIMPVPAAWRTRFNRVSFDRYTQHRSLHGCSSSCDQSDETVSIFGMADGNWTSAEIPSVEDQTRRTERCRTCERKNPPLG
jgi:short subunit dehydrogenase-like uncharacterized protein